MKSTVGEIEFGGLGSLVKENCNGEEKLVSIAVFYVLDQRQTNQKQADRKEAIKSNQIRSKEAS